LASVATEENCAFVGVQPHATKNMTENMWVADSGAMCHIINEKTRLYDTQEISKPITIGSGQTVTAILNRKLDQRVKTANGTVIVTLTDVKYIRFWVKLFSLLCAMKNGSKIKSKGMQLSVEKDDTSLTFKNCADTKNGCILGLEMTPMMKETAQAVVQTVKENMNILHGKLGHASIESV